MQPIQIEPAGGDEGLQPSPSSTLSVVPVSPDPVSSNSDKLQSGGKTAEDSKHGVERGDSMNGSVKQKQPKAKTHTKDSGKRAKTAKKRKSTKRGKKLSTKSKARALVN